MNRRTFVILMRLLFVAMMAVFLGIAPSLRAQNNSQNDGKKQMPTMTPEQMAKQKITPAQRKAAAANVAATQAAAVAAGHWPSRPPW